MADILKEFRGVKRRLAKLQELLLPGNVAGPRGYSSHQQDLISSYVLLAHAEVEGFLEFCAFEAAETAFNAWTNQLKMRSLCRLVFFHNNRAEKLGDYEMDEKSVSKALNFYKAAIVTNHGVKAKNIYNLFFPLGLVHTDFDEVWLATMNSFGSKRGDNAHNWVKTRQSIDPHDISRDVNTIIVPELRTLALRIKKLD